jgi:hypothetical protein
MSIFGFLLPWTRFWPRLIHAFKPNLTRAQANLSIAALTAKLKMLDGPPHTLCGRRLFSRTNDSAAKLFCRSGNCVVPEVVDNVQKT